MRTREESIEAFISSIDNLKDKKYLFASSGLFAVSAAINSSRILTEIFEYFSDNLNFYVVYQECFVNENGAKSFKMPSNKTVALAFIFSILNQINHKDVVFTDLLDYFLDGKNYDVAYNNFYETVLVPFKEYTCQVVDNMIKNLSKNSDDGLGENAMLEPLDANEVDVTIDDIRPIKNTSKLLRLADLDALTISQSKLSDDDKEEMNFVLNTFVKELKGGDVDKIRLAFIAYNYCMKYYKKVKSNVEQMTKILYENGVL